MIIQNAIECPDGKILWSTHRHDYQDHTVGNEWFMVDGGKDYCRCGGGTPKEDLYLTDTSTIKEVLDTLLWKSYFDKDDKRLTEPKVRRMKDLDTDHLRKIAELKDVSLLHRWVALTLVDQRTEADMFD